MTDEQIKNIVNKLLNKFITKGTLPGEHRQMILLEEEVDELEFDLTQSLQKYGEKVREEARNEFYKESNTCNVAFCCECGGLFKAFHFPCPSTHLTSLTKQEKGQR